MRIAVFGSSLLSAYWNGACTYYRGMIRALHARGHRVAFFEPDIFDRAAHRDLASPGWAQVHVYAAETEAQVCETVRLARGFDVVAKCSGVGRHDDLLAAEVAALPGVGARVYWDVDAPATLAALEADPAHPLRALLSEYDAVLTYGGGDGVVRRYLAAGARRCVPLYNAVDAATHRPVAPSGGLRSDLTLLANRLPDRERRVAEFFFAAARIARRRRFLLGGAGWDDVEVPENVRRLGHVPPSRHNVANCSALAVLNVTRDDMAAAGWSPPTRVFEAAGAGACLISDPWPGIADFLEPDREILVAESGASVAELLDGLAPERARAIGRNARSRVLAEHTYDHRAARFERVLAES